MGAEGLSGPAPTGGFLSCANKKVTKEVARGPLPAPWTPGAAVPDLRPLCAFSIEPSSGLSAAWGDTRRPPPFGCWNWEGAGFEGFSLLEFSGSPAGWLPPWRRGFPSLAFSGILPEGLSGPAPTGGSLSCAGKKVTKETAGGLCRPPGPQALSFETCSRSVPSG